MKRLYLLIFIFNCSLSLFAQQTVSELTNGCGQFLDAKKYIEEQVVKARDGEGKPVEMPTYVLNQIFNLQVIPYFNVQGYDTELKQELFKETDEYKELEIKLREEREVVKNTRFFYIHPLGSNYSLDNGGFLYQIELYEGRYVNFNGYINHGTLCIEYATKRFPKNRIEIIKRWGGSDYFYNQRVYFPVKDKQVALKIEDAGKKQVGVLFIFKIDSVQEKRPFLFDVSFVLTKTEGIYIVNTQTGEIYCRVL